MNIKIKEKRGITLVSLVVTIIVLLILSAVSVAMLTGENGIFKTAQKAKIESQKADYRETIELSKVEEGINKKLNRTKKEKLEGIYNILRNGEKFKKDVDSSKASMELIDNDELEPRIVIKTKEGWKYTVTVDGIIEGEIPPIDLEKADIKIEIEPTGWTNEDVEVVSIKVQNEEYKENKIQYSYDLKTWRDYKDTKKIKITENKKIYARLANGLSISDKYATGNITNIDKKEAEISTAMNSSNVTTKGFTVNVGVKDENSGLGKIVWYYKKSDATSYTSEEVIYKDLHSVQAGETTAVTKSKTYDNLTSGTYNVYAEIYDVAGNITNANSSDKPLEIKLGTVTASLTPNTTSWTNSKVTITASTNTEIYYGINTKTMATKITNGGTFTVSENCTIYYYGTDGTNTEGSTITPKALSITNIDTLAPKDFNITTTSSTGTITVTANTTDADATSTSGSSGIAGYRFKLNNENWTNYQTSGTYSFSNLIGSVSGEKYNIYVETKDNSGNVTLSTKEAYTIKDNDYYVDKANTLIGEVDYNYSVNRKYYKTNDEPAIVVWSTIGNFGEEYDYFGPLLVSTSPDAVKYYTSDHLESFSYESSFEYNGVTFYVSAHAYFFETDRSVYKSDYLSIGNVYDLYKWPDIGKELATRYFTGSTDKNYTVYYNANGGTGIPNMQNKRKDSSITLSSTIPTRSGYHFLGWSTNKTSTTAEYSAGGNYNLNKSEILYAVWQKHDNENDIKGTCSICGGGDKLMGTEQLNEQWDFTAKHNYSTGREIINENGRCHMWVSFVANWNGSTGDYSQGGNIGMLISKNKVDLTNVDKIIMNCSLADNHNSGINYTTLGISSFNSSSSSSDYEAFNKSVTVSHKGPSFENKKCTLDVNDISGEYYLKVTTKHDLKVNLAYTANTYIDSIFLVYK